MGRVSGDDRDELREVSAAVLAVTSHLSVREVLRTILGAAQRLLDAEYAALGVPDEHGAFAEFLALGMTDAQWAAIGPLPRQHGLLAAMLRSPATLRLADIRSHPRFEGWPAAHPELTSFLGAPIVDGDDVLGELFLANKRGAGGFTARDEELLRLLAGHAAIAIVNARLYERSRELSIVAERARIARELHDAVAQKLFSLRLTAEAADTLLTTDPQAAARQLATVKRLAADSADELRAIVVGLRPTDLAGDGLEVALRKQVDLLDRVHAATVAFDGAALPPLPAAVEQAVYRVVQEALHNALRHADARTVTVRVRGDAGRVRVEVADDGVGFDPDPQARAGRRLGLASMRERARAVGGRLTVTSAPGGGTTIRLQVPPSGGTAIPPEVPPSGGTAVPPEVPA